MDDVADVVFVNEADMKYLPISEVRKQYDGYVVCLVRCNITEYSEVLGGEPFAFSKSLGDLIGATMKLTDGEDTGDVSYETLTGFPDSPIQVVEL